jgi:hypothetical protein
VKAQVVRARFAARHEAASVGDPRQGRDLAARRVGCDYGTVASAPNRQICSAQRDPAGVGGQGHDVGGVRATWVMVSGSPSVGRTMSRRPPLSTKTMIDASGDAATARW